MKHVIPVVFCIIALFLYAFFCALVGWNHGGGTLIMAIFWLSIIPGAWWLGKILHAKSFSGNSAAKVTKPTGVIHNAALSASVSDDTALYAKAMKELDAQETRDPGAWAKAFSMSPDNEALLSGLKSL